MLNFDNILYSLPIIKIKTIAANCLNWFYKHAKTTLSTLLLKKAKVSLLRCNVICSAQLTVLNSHEKN